MKQIAAVLLSILLLVHPTTHTAAATYVEMQTTQKTAVLERASGSAEEIATVKEGYRFTPIGSTKSYWKIAYTDQKRDTVQTGYLLKTHTEERPSDAGASGAENSPGSPSQKKTVTVYWVVGGKVYHLSQNCSTLKRSKNIQSGTVEDSQKPRACKVCG